MVELESKGYKWLSGDKPTSKDYWSDDKEKSCVKISGEDITSASLDFYKENYPHDYIGSAGAYIRKNLLFKTVLKRMKKGEDFYKIVFKDNYADSIARERIFEGMAQNLKIDYEEIYFIWLKN
jgi:hypothetical protein